MIPKFVLMVLLMVSNACQNELSDVLKEEAMDSLLTKYEQRVIIQKHQRDEAREDIRWSANQSIAIYDNFLFVFMEGWKDVHPVVCVIDRTTNHLISRVKLPEFSSVGINHCNSAQFSHRFLKEGDEFPLLYLSSYFSGDLYVVRIVREGMEFSFELVQRLTTDNEAARKFGNSYCIDADSGMLFMYYNEHGNYQVKEDNDLIIEEYLLPGLDEKEVVLDSRKMLHSMRLPFVVFQGSCCSGGHLLLGVQGTENFLTEGSYVLMLDVAQQEIVDLIRVRGGEPEGLAVSDHKLYLSMRKTQALLDREMVFMIVELTPKEPQLD